MTQLQNTLLANTSALLVDAGYERESLIPNYSYTWRSAYGTLVNSEATLVAFAGRPFNMRNACLTVSEVGSDDQTTALLRQLAYLSAPLALVASPTSMSLWSLKRDVEAQRLLSFPPNELAATLRGRLSEMGPATLMAAKLGQAQLSFVDAGLWEWAEKITADTLVRLLEGLLASTLESLAPSSKHSPAAQRAIVRLVFQLFACRVLEEKKIIPQDLDAADSLERANQQFSDNIDPQILESRFISASAATRVQHELRSRFAFSSLTTEMLGHAYEHALVTPQLRKQQGIYYTPPSITRYILESLPIESIEPEDRLLLDPACGSGSFLLAGFDRLAGLLPPAWSAGLRHTYLRSRIIGFDTDSFAREVASLSLLLADLQNRNGWKIREGDVTELDVRSAGGRRPSIIVTNPPFKEIKAGTGPRRELSAEILQRLVGLLAADGLLGIVVPQSLLVSRTGRDMRRTLLNEGDLLEISTLPGGVFYSQADTAALMFRKAGVRRRFANSAVTVRELRAQDLSRFEKTGCFTSTYTGHPEDWRKDVDNRFVLSPLIELWDRLAAQTTTLGAVADVRIGLQIKPTDKTSVSDSRRDGDVKFVDRAHALKPFLLDEGSARWLRYGSHLHRARDRRLFESSKALVNSTRNPGSPWRLVAAVAGAGLFFNTNFQAILPTDPSVTLEEIVAILNSPVANAWIDAQTRNRWVAVEVLRNLPVPVLDPMSREVLVARVRELQSLKSRQSSADLFSLLEGAFDDPRVERLLIEIDDIVYDGYGLSRRQRAEVEQVMRAGKRPR